MPQRIPRGAIRGIILDAVGTLIEPRPTVAEAYAAAARRQGVQLDIELVRTRFRRAFRHHEPGQTPERLVTDEPAERARWRSIVAAALPEAPDQNRAFDELWDHFGQASSWRVFDDAVPALDALSQQGFRLRIASNFDGRLRALLRGLTQLAHHAEPLIISSEVGYRKPHRAFYRAACESLEMPAGAVLCVGDDHENDVAGPRRAGMCSVLLGRDRNHVRAGDVIGSLTELPAWLRHHNQTARPLE